MMFAAVLALHCQMTKANEQPLRIDTVYMDEFFYPNGMLLPLKPTYEGGVEVFSPWRGNWFLSVQGGGSAFLGNPLGCNDLFGRTKPAIEASLGKWFTPSIGVRASYQGWRFVDCENGTNTYKYIHTDLLWDVIGCRYSKKERVHWGFIPFVGTGLLDNRGKGVKSFAISYGIQGQYKFSSHAALVVELSNATTFRCFDGYGDRDKLGDNLLSLTAGLSITIGKAGWKRVVNATPYISQNEWLRDYVYALLAEKRELLNKMEMDGQTLAELQKILEIEGLMEKYGELFDNSITSSPKAETRNSYSGLNALRARLNNRSWDGASPLVEEPASGNEEIVETANGATDNGYLASMRAGESCVGSPIYFFFEYGSCNLTDASQSINLDALAEVALRYGLAIRVAGAADSATGTPESNNSLSESRATYIATELVDRGVSPNVITVVSEGGISEYSPNEANRHTRVMLYIQ